MLFNYKKTLLASPLLALTFNSCSTLIPLDTVEKDNQTQSIKPSQVNAIPLMVETDVDLTKKISGNSSGDIKGVYTVNYYKEQALIQAINAGNCDVLYNPLYTITTTHSKKQGKIITKVDITVVGYPAKYKNIRTMVPSDTVFINAIDDIERQDEPMNFSPSFRKETVVLPKVGAKIY